jgi:MbtH protein
MKSSTEKGEGSMAWDEDDQTVYVVVVNHEEQYSIWPDYRPIPDGWRAAGKTGPKAECLAYIDELWTDMRPLSLRKQMAEAERRDPSQTNPHE